MLQHTELQRVADWVTDVALLCSTVKPSLFVIGEFVVFVFGLITIVVWAIRGHRQR